ncbi:Uncharacterised protein [Mycobacteroides abscessus subsp. abscessus]|nr:Uncharacterised protein [Mycobacteroides abscessus subsp. abscessus]
MREHVDAEGPDEFVVGDPGGLPHELGSVGIQFDDAEDGSEVFGAQQRRTVLRGDNEHSCAVLPVAFGIGIGLQCARHPVVRTRVVSGAGRCFVDGFAQRGQEFLTLRPRLRDHYDLRSDAVVAVVVQALGRDVAGLELDIGRAPPAGYHDGR